MVCMTKGTFFRAPSPSPPVATRSAAAFQSDMDLAQQLPPLSTLTPISTLPNVPPDRPPDPTISVLFPETTPYRVPNNPFRGPPTSALKEAHKQSINEALSDIRRSFLYTLDELLEFDGKSVGVDFSTENFNAAVIIVIATIEWGYYPARDQTPLNTNNWAKLSCALLAAIGWGYHRQYTTEQESNLDNVRAKTLDPNPLAPEYPTLFHWLAATAEEVTQHTKPGQEGYQDWYAHIKKRFTEKATKAVAADINEKWLAWKANELDRLAKAHQTVIAAEARKGGDEYFIVTAARVGLHCTPSNSPARNTTQTPTITTGRKHTVSGSSRNPRRRRTPTSRFSWLRPLTA